MKKKRVPKVGSPDVRKWVVTLRRKVKHDRLKVAEQDIFHLAGLICLLRNESDRHDTFWTLHGFLLSKQRIPRLRSSLEFLPSEPGELWRVIEALRYFSTVTGASVSAGNLKPDLILRTMSQVPNHKTYIDHLFQRGFTSLGGIYHTNTLKRTKTELRGLFGGSSDYLANPQDNLNIIND